VIYARAVAASGGAARPAVPGGCWCPLVSAGVRWCPLVSAGVRWCPLVSAGGVPHHVGTPPGSAVNVNKPFILD